VPGVALSVRKISAHACERIARRAFELARKRNKLVTAVHKATVFRAERGRSGQRMRAVARRDPVHSRDIDSWVRRNGGFPANGMRVMNNREAGQFWRRCELRR
jgi:isocitrate dehydrogenase